MGPDTILIIYLLLFVLQGRSYTPFEYDADTAVNNLNVGGMAIADEGEAAVPANAVNANPPNTKVIPIHCSGCNCRCNNNRDKIAVHTVTLEYTNAKSVGPANAAPP